MSAERFSLDTNVLFYSLDARDAGKNAIARRVIHGALHRDCVVTLQALGEFYWAATRKGRIPASEAEAQVGDWLDMFPVVAADPSTLRIAMRSARRGQFSFWDATMLATAEAAGCRLMLSEDMRDGARLGGIVVRNPFGPNGVPDDLQGVIGP